MQPQLACWLTPLLWYEQLQEAGKNHEQRRCACTGCLTCVARSAAKWYSSSVRPGGLRGLRSAAAYASTATVEDALRAATSTVSASMDLRKAQQSEEREER